MSSLYFTKGRFTIDVYLLLLVAYTDIICNLFFYDLIHDGRQIRRPVGLFVGKLQRLVVDGNREKREPSSTNVQTLLLEQQPPKDRTLLSS